MKLFSHEVETTHVYIAQNWQYELFSEMAQSRGKNQKTSEVLRVFFEKNPSADRKEVAAASGRIAKLINELGEEFIGSFLKLD